MTGTAQGPRWRFRLPGGWTLERYDRAERRWGANARGRGVDLRRTPLGALLALRRWLRVPSTPIPPDG